MRVTAPIPPLSSAGLIEDERNTIAVFRETAASAVFVTAVTLHDQSTHEAVVRGVEPRKDIAVLKIEVPANKLKAIAHET